MQVPLQISFRDMAKSDTVEARIRERVEALERFYDRITACRVVVEAPHRQHQQGKLYQIRIDLTVPGGEVVVNRNHPFDHSHEDIYVAIRDAFDAARRQLEDHVRKFRGDTKTHDAPTLGRIARLFAHEGYGFLTSEEAGDIYFDRHAVASGDFDQLNVGDEVRYVMHPGEGEKGPQASTVIPVGKRHTPDHPVRPS